MKKANVAVNVLRVIFALSVVVLVIYFIFNRDKFTVDMLIGIAPHNLFLAFLFFMLIYALKSLSIFFPVIVLQISAGLIFSPFWGTLVNILGAFCEVLVPYLFARYTGVGQGLIDKMMSKYPSVENLINEHSKNQFFLSFFLRILGFLPLDVISMLLGVLKIDFWKFAVGSVLGMLPGILSATIMGASITDPFSPQFIISILATGVISVSSLVLYIVFVRRKKRKA